MARRYETLENLQTLVGLVSGTGVVLSVLQNWQPAALMAGVAAAVMPLAALIFKWREKATFFAGRSEAYQRLKLDLELKRRPPEDVIAERVQLEMQEGEPSHTLWRISGNEEARVLGLAGNPLTWGQKVVALAFYFTVPAKAPRQLPAGEASVPAQ
ncbi:hypothetical protein [Novosphingobium sp. NDB2Meth1]|uniref:hypothetical protein n=1 Tax=Novosphingobium sp. NDB2Meth1 TaxID=1892847 RepID=UPI0009312844|nr:hypothetical protein [Novosphingobium sp. NDB2Meth1]